MLARPRTLPVGSIQPCLPIKVPKPPTGAAWLHEIKHDGYRLMARRGRSLAPREVEAQGREIKRLDRRERDAMQTDPLFLTRSGRPYIPSTRVVRG